MLKCEKIVHDIEFWHENGRKVVLLEPETIFGEREPAIYQCVSLLKILCGENTKDVGPESPND